jgi:hypothetical protein
MKKKPRKNLFGHRGAPKHVTPLQHQHFLSSLGQVRGIDQPVVPAANHNHVVVLPHANNSAIKKKAWCPGDRTFY